MNFSIQNYPCAHHEGKQRQHNTFPHILYLGTTQGHCSPPSPNHFNPKYPPPRKLWTQQGQSGSF